MVNYFIFIEVANLISLDSFGKLQEKLPYLKKRFGNTPTAYGKYILI